MKTVLITGASTGIGAATALLFAQKGWNVLATMRSPDKAVHLKNVPNITLMPLDVIDQASIDAAIASTLSRFGTLDVLVNNAGYGAVGAFEAATEAQIMRQFETNVFGLMRVTRAVLPHFREKHAGTIINISSIGGRMTFPLYSLYHGTKFAVEGFSESLNYELRQFGIRVKLVEPGAIRTDFYDRSQDVLIQPGLPHYDAYFNKVNTKMQIRGAGAPGPETVARVIYQAATSTSARIRYVVGAEPAFLLFMRRILPDSWFTGLVKTQLE